MRFFRSGQGAGAGARPTEAGCGKGRRGCGVMLTLSEVLFARGRLPLVTSRFILDVNKQLDEAGLRGCVGAAREWTMTDVVSAFPSQDAALALLRRLVENDPPAPSELATAYLEPLARWLARANPQTGTSECDTAAEDAILWLIKHPASYDPAGMTLEAYLRMAAKRDLQNVQRAEGRHASRRADWGAVELSRSVGKHVIDVDSDPARIVELQEMVEEIVRKRPRMPAAALAGLTPGEVQALGLVECGERRTELYAVALGISHLPPEQQQTEVKRVKDRLKVRLKRAGVFHD